MRIEIKAGIGPNSLDNTLDMIDKYIGRAKNVVGAFKAVKSQVYNMNGGVGILSGAVAEVDRRIEVEQQRVENAVKVREKGNSFLDLVRRIDNKAASDVRRNKEEFYKVNPWARPPKPQKEKSWGEKAWGWLCDRGKDIAEGFHRAKEGLKKFAKGVYELGKAAVNWACDTLEKIGTFIKDHWKSFVKLAAAAVVIVGLCLVVAFASPAAGFIAAMALVGAGKKIISKVTVNCIKNAFAKDGDKKDWFDLVADSVFEGTMEGAAEGAADGFGYMYGPAARWAAGAVLQTGSSAIVSGTNYLMSDGDKSWSGFGKEVGKASLKGLWESGKSSLSFTLKFNKGGGVPLKDQFMDHPLKENGINSFKDLKNATISFGDKKDGLYKVGNVIFGKNDLADKFDVMKIGKDVLKSTGAKAINTTLNSIIKEKTGTDVDFVNLDFGKGGFFNFTSFEGFKDSGLGKTLVNTGKSLFNGYLKQPMIDAGKNLWTNITS